MASLEERLAKMRQSTTGVDENLQQRLQAMGQSVRGGDEVSTGDAFTLGGLSSFLNNAFELPEDTINTLNEGLQLGVGAAVPGFGLPAMAQRFGLPTDVDLPNPEATDVFAGAQLAGEAAGAVRTGDFGQFSTFGQARDQQQRRVNQAQQDQPFAFGAGEVAGDAATIVTGRAPIKSAFTRSGTPAKVASAGGGFRGVVDDILKTPTVRSLGRAAGKSVEAGLEGAVIGILNDSDKDEMRALAAGGSLGSLFGSAAQQITPSSKRGAIGFGAFVAGTTALARLAQEFGIGGDPNLFNAADFAFDKAKFALLAGAASGALGFGGRIPGPNSGAVRNSIAKNMPQLADAITAIPRASTLSLAERMFNERQEGRDTTARILNTLATNPDQFSQDVRDRIKRGIENNRVNEVIDGLLKDDEFRKRVGE